MLTVTDILGVRVQSGKVRDVVAHIDNRVMHRSTTRVAFLNANLSNECSRRPTMRERLGDFLVLNDGVGVDIARRVLHGTVFEENLNGTDFVTSYLDSTDHDLRIFLLGARGDVIERTAEKMGQRWPRHTVVGRHHGYLRESDEPSILATIASARADLILVGMGNPRQESWIAAHVPEVCPCGIAVGAWFDFFAEAVPRAPAWIRSARLEWVYRLCLEPRRLARRYLIGNVVFLSRLAAAKVRGDLKTT
ncbi:WecB/TagA/CpsF family glycosyltransferase [Methylobacterium sp. E-025]|jgi:alpha-1,3-mannosyltransferase|uniref:WecB/TagA/CpsF family glycosyltransferase n=1 Tax=unclassified Methylobacterium TaxID=2615210 RepID=UPI0011CA4F3C|nr:MULTISPECIES: WecB/TagA/CpsF family glycosyltransferase [unclassified Methylobacterium]MCJ2010511.1 WecB/TagA/CpsF family glycosyltransferase [Methylobacterium sp. J-092]MCJ2038563.1 WecB/TagA/CpsF family glycosyltransferase [Methylobacterium sp. J-059]MCJ2114695.1 WecB/TagA/CpsF family glycosyltransferase [Methylobacterium sp. E-025]TXN72280.1 WecB/TagA/CpsF family glycosyltransferase [Methylobacterium sp. WL6]